MFLTRPSFHSRLTAVTCQSGLINLYLVRVDGPEGKPLMEQKWSGRFGQGAAVSAQFYFRDASTLKVPTFMAAKVDRKAHGKSQSPIPNCS